MFPAIIVVFVVIVVVVVVVVIVVFIVVVVFVVIVVIIVITIVVIADPPHVTIAIATAIPIAALVGTLLGGGWPWPSSSWGGG